MSDSQTTSSPRWMSRVFHALLVTALLVMVGFRVYGYFATSETQLNANHRRSTTGDLQHWKTRANDAFQQENWAVAAEEFGKVTQEEPTNVRARVRLAHALHCCGKYDEALAEFLYACRFDGDVRRWALYNIACVYALKGDKRLALDYLNEAADEGFRTRKPVDEDPDFKSLWADPEFQHLAEMLKPVSQRNVYHRFDFLIGQWKIGTANSRRVGSLIVSKGAEGFSLLGECIDESRSLRMTFLAFYDPDIDDWRQLWLDERGNVMEIQSEPSEGESLILRGHLAAAGGRKELARAIYTDKKKGIVHIELATSADQGTTWSPLLDADLLPRQELEVAREPTRDSPTP